MRRSVEVFSIQIPLLWLGLGALVAWWALGKPMGGLVDVAPVGPSVASGGDYRNVPGSFQALNAAVQAGGGAAVLPLWGDRSPVGGMYPQLDQVMPIVMTQ